MLKNNLGDLLARVVFLLSIVTLVLVYGLLSARFNIFPYPQFSQAEQYLRKIVAAVSGEKSWHYIPTTAINNVSTFQTGASYPGLNLVTAVQANETLSAYIVDVHGVKKHSWDVDWFEVWPEPDHLPEKSKPKSRPGTHIHGAVVLPDGGIIYNYEHLGLVRLDICGRVVWRLPYRTHHSVHADMDGNLWVSGQKDVEHRNTDFPNYEPPYIEPVLLKVSTDGEILKEISVFHLLQENGLAGLLYLSTRKNTSTHVSGDTLHLNDIEPFPGSIEEGVFNLGDVMISLRNANTILVFDENTGKVKSQWTGQFVRQHDPDFIDGNTISVFDNNNISVDPDVPQSRILLLSAAGDSSRIYYEGSAQSDFYTNIMGKHQWLSNGNLLITESMKGRAFELDQSGKIVWEYINIVEPGWVGIMEEVQRLPELYDEIYSASNIASQCGTLQ